LVEYARIVCSQPNSNLFVKHGTLLDNFGDSTGADRASALADREP